ncbi:unnamed protein product [Pseudo-nitzschia multistriata]|uniref:Uncharacterized protein n=1 Tax=Pseudo-nitzschia multistriata TaxID=183589 RepID=A0A448Z664_9STRA|nr:unnamed protein product [Pseudo-nitzschia multistriata]
MKDHAVVVTPNRETLRHQVNVAAFAASQASKTPLSSRPLTPGRSRRGGGGVFRSKSPGKRHAAGYRDLAQEVYDRMGVNYVRGQNSIDLYDSTSSISISSTKRHFQSPDRGSPVSSITSRTSGLSGVSRASVTSEHPKERAIGGPGVASQRNAYSSVRNRYSPSADTRSDQDERNWNRNPGSEDEERESFRSARSVKSMVSVFSGGKSTGSYGRSVASNKSSYSAFKAPPNFVNAAFNQGQKRISDNDNDVNTSLSFGSLDEGRWVNKQQNQYPQEQPQRQVYRSRSFSSSRRSSFQNSKAFSSSSMSSSHPNNTSCDKMIEKLVKEKVEEKLTELDASFEDRLRRIDTDINSRLNDIETKLNMILKVESSPALRKWEKSSNRTPKNKRSFSYERLRL